MGLFGGTQIKTNKEEFSAECRGMECSGDSKVFNRTTDSNKIAVICFRRSKVTARELRRIRTTRLDVYLYDIVNIHANADVAR